MSLAIEAPAAPRRRRHELLGRLTAHRGALVGGSVILLVVALAVLAPLLTAHDPFEQDLSRRLLRPVWSAKSDWAHPLGTDEFGRDYLARLIYGTRVCLLVGLSVTLIAGLIGSALGIAAGYFGGRVDMAVMLLVTVRLAMPSILVALAVVALVGSSIGIVIVVLGLLMWDRFAVVLRSATQQVRSNDYIAGARAVGCSPLRVILGEVLPNVRGHLIVVASLEFGHAVLAEAALSFLGLGVQPPTPSWGLMVSEGKRFLLFEPWLICLPGFALCALVLAVNLLGDAVRDVLTPGARP